MEQTSSRQQIHGNLWATLSDSRKDLHKNDCRFSMTFKENILLHTPSKFTDIHTGFSTNFSCVDPLILIRDPAVRSSRDLQSQKVSGRSRT